MVSRVVNPGAVHQTISVEVIKTDGTAKVLAWNSAGLALSIVTETNGQKTTTALTPQARTLSGTWGPAGGFESVGGATHEIDLPDSAMVGPDNIVSIALTATGVFAAFSETIGVQPLPWSDGINPVTITVTDGTNPLANVIVTASVGGVAADTQITNGSGVANLTLRDGTYSVNVGGLAGYGSTTASVTISGAYSHTYPLTQILVTPSTPPKVTGYIVVLDDDQNPASGIPVTLKTTKVPAGSTGLGLVGDIQSQLSNGSGIVEFVHIIGATYQIAMGNGPWLTYIAPNTTFAINSIIGLTG